MHYTFIVKAEDNFKGGGLLRQGISLVALFLLLEISFFCALWWLVGQAQAEADAQNRARQVRAKASSLMLVVYDTGDALGRKARGADGDVAAAADSVRSKSARDAAFANIAFLDKELKGNATAEKLLYEIQENIKVCLPVMAEIEMLSTNLEDEENHRLWQEKRATIQPNIAVLLKTIPSLVRLCQHEEDAAPQAARDNRSLTIKILCLILFLNSSMGLLLVGLFTSRIVGRLSVLEENTRRIKEHKPLLEPLEGKDNDEIVYLDTCFREALDSLDRERELLKDSERKMRTLVEKLPVGIFIVNDKLSVEFANIKAGKIFNSSAQDLEKKSLAKLIPTIHDEGRKRGIRANGRVFPLELTQIELLMARSGRSLAVVSDLSEREALNKSRDAFVAMVRQELKDPLSRVAEFFNKFVRGVFPGVSEKGLKSAGQMEQNVDRLLVLLNDLFDLDKIESGKIDIEPESVPLNTILERSHNGVAMFAQKYKVKLETASSDLVLFVDGNRIVQVLINLLSNAIKFSNPGGLVSIGIKTFPTHVDIGVIDRGRGIPKEKLALVFEPYKQVEESDAKKKGGTGLGLAICKAIMDAHGGEIGVESAEGRGSVFWIRIPLKGGARS